MNDFNELDDRHDRFGRRHPGRRRGVGTVLLGLAILSAGIILTLDNFDLLYAQDYLIYWPAFVILAGLTHLLRPASSRRWGSGLFWMAVGALLLGNNLDLIDVDLMDLWPVLLIFFGLSMLLRGFRRQRRGPADGSATFSATAVMGADVRRITADDFQGGEATAVMGGCEIDLRGAGNAGGPAEIDCFALWGGIEIWVPDDWEVQVDGTAILAGFDDKTRSPAGAPAKTLIIRGTAIMAGVDIKN